MTRCWHVHGKILQDFLRDDGKIMAISLQDLAKILQEFAGFRQDHGKAMA